MWLSMAPEYELRVLVHPIKSSFTTKYHPIWDDWIHQGCKVLSGGSNPAETVLELEDVSYVDQLPQDATIILGGQRRDFCEAIHYDCLTSHPRAIDGSVVIKIAKEASASGKLSNLKAIAQKNNYPLIFI